VIRTAILAAAAAVLLSVPTQAATPRLDLDRANRAAQAEAHEWQEFWNWEEDDSHDETPVYIASYELDACDRVSAARAECEVTYDLTDGDRCDDTIVIRTTRRDLLRVWSWGQVCDSEVTP
jgi:hypothetical protein